MRKRQGEGAVVGTREAEDLCECACRPAPSFAAATSVAAYFAFIALRMFKGTTTWLGSFIILDCSGCVGVNTLPERNGKGQVRNNHGHASFADVPGRKVEICLDNGKDAVEKGNDNLWKVRHYRKMKVLCAVTCLKQRRRDYLQ